MEKQLNASEQFLKNNNILPFVQFSDKEVHKIIVAKDKLDKKTFNNQEKSGVTYLVTENGAPSTFFTTSIGLIQKLSKWVGTEQELEVQMKSVNVNGKYVNRFSVNKAGELMPESEEDIKDSIPVIDDSEPISEQPF